ncbi:MAG: type II toxin-antitoxin system VapC family toxin [Gemmatimonadetes bacterium]|nr:type II toxin-antitoxin system VapC family toxin [Gemmatimonadota bacterium]
MPRYVLDTQHFIDVLKDRPAAAEVLTFLRAFVAVVDFHAVVGAELLMGARSRGEPAAIRKRFIDPFKPQRVIVPDLADLLAAGDAIRRMSEQRGVHPELERRNFWNDVMIAVSCRRRGVVLLTRDPDHARIAPVVGHTYSATFLTSP